MTAMVNNNFLPDHLIVEILLRLPVKCLKRFSCVCKAWYAVFKDPIFMAKHLDRTNFYDDGNARILIRHTGEYSFSMLSSETLDVSTRIGIPIFRGPRGQRFPQVYGPCNGILCLYSYHNGAALWNPATREIKSLPRTDMRDSAFQPIRECHFSYVAFGHDPKTDDYKLLRFSTSSKEPWPIQKMELYTLSSEFWRPMDLDMGVHIDRLNFMDTRMKGRNHWLGSRHDNGYTAILYFDMSDEVFGVITLPDSFRNQKGEMTVYNEMIALIFYPVRTTAIEKRFDVWVMCEYGVRESWTRLYTIGPVSGVERPLGFWKNGGVFMESSRRELLLYHHPTQQFKNVGVSSVVAFFEVERNMQVTIYKESQVCLDGRHEEEDGIIRVP